MLYITGYTIHALIVGVLLYSLVQLLLVLALGDGVTNPSNDLTSIAGLVHVNGLNLTTQILVSPCHICSVYAINKFGLPRKILRFVAYTEQV